MTASGDRLPVRLSSCLSVRLFLCVWPCEGLGWGLNWAAVKHTGRMWSPYSCGFEGFQKGHKKQMTKKILVVYKFICFHGFVIIAKQSGKAACADWALNCCMLWASLTTWWQNQPTNRMEDGRWNMHCTVLKYFTWSKYPDNKNGNIPIVVNTRE